MFELKSLFFTFAPCKTQQVQSIIETAEPLAHLRSVSLILRPLITQMSMDMEAIVSAEKH